MDKLEVGDTEVSFDLSGLGAIDLANIQELSIKAEVSQGFGIDAELGAITATVIPLPAPALLLIGGLGLLGAAARRRA